MIIINKKAKRSVKAWSGVGFRKLEDMTDKAEHVDVQGFEEESDVDDKKARKKVLKTHPFRRKERFLEDVPGIIRWLWNPRTGEIISSAGRSTEHALMLHNYKNRLKKSRKDASLPPYDEWIRGFYFPKTHELAIRPYYLEAFRPTSSMAIRTSEDEELYYQMAQEESRRIQKKIADILGRQLGAFKRTHFDVGDEYLRDHFQGVGGERW